MNDAVVGWKGVLDTAPLEQVRERAWTFRTVGFGHDALYWKTFVSALRESGYDDVLSIEHEDALDRMAALLKARPEILDRRRETVEHPFGSIKQWMNQGAFLMRGLEKVRAEFSLKALVNNLRRALNILGMDKMMAAVAA